MGRSSKTRLLTHPLLGITGKFCPKCLKFKEFLEFHPRLLRYGKHGWTSYCKKCQGEWHKAYRKRSREYMRASTIKAKYGKPVEEFDAQLVLQEGKCKICERDIRGKYHIDHNHITGEIRGLLCNRCNVRIGTLDEEEFIRKVMKYLGFSITRIKLEGE